MQKNVKADSTSHFILKIPPSILLRSFYSWVIIIGFLNWYPAVSLLFGIFVLINLLILKAQRSIWEKLINENHLNTGPVRYIDRSRTPFPYLVLNVIIVLLIGSVIGYYLDGRANWSWLQWFLMTAGFWLLEQGFLLFWTPTKYILTDQGIWILHDVIKPFIQYKEITEMRLLRDYRTPIGQGYMLIRIKYPAALYLLPVNPTGFTAFIKQLILTPSDVESFLQSMPSRLIKLST